MIWAPTERASRTSVSRLQNALSRGALGTLLAFGITVAALGQDLVPAPTDLEVPKGAEQSPFAKSGSRVFAPPLVFAPPSSKLDVEFSRLVADGNLKTDTKPAAHNDRLAEALAHFNRCSFERALELFELEIVNDFTSIPAHLGRARVKIVYGQYRKALPDLDYVIGRDSKHVEAFRLRAFCHMRLGLAGGDASLEDAMAGVARVLELEPRDPAARAIRGAIAVRRGECDCAIADLSYAIESQGDDLSSNRWLHPYYFRALAFMSKGDYRRAMDDFSRAAHFFDPDRVDMQFLLYRGLCHTYNRDYDNSIADFTAAIEKHPGNYELYRYRAKSYWEKNDLDRACADFDRIVRLRPDAPHVYLDRSTILWSRGDIARAMADADRVVQLCPQFAAVYFYRAVMSILLCHDGDRALADLDRAVSIEPRFALFHAVRAGVYIQEEKYVPACKSLALCALTLRDMEFNVNWYIDNRQKRLSVGLSSDYVRVHPEPKPDISSIENHGIELSVRRLVAAMFGSSR
jgi:tetratricopeptide (TPR) repeat protein